MAAASRASAYLVVVLVVVGVEHPHQVLGAGLFIGQGEKANLGWGQIHQVIHQDKIQQALPPGPLPRCLAVLQGRAQHGRHRLQGPHLTHGQIVRDVFPDIRRLAVSKRDQIGVEDVGLLVSGMIEYPGHQGVEMFLVGGNGRKDKRLAGRAPRRQPKGPEYQAVDPGVMIVALIAAEDRVQAVFPEIIQEPPGPGGRQVVAVPEIDKEASQGDGRGLPRIIGPVGEAELRELGRDLPAIAVGRAQRRRSR